jgi:hypothetical protein
MVDIPAEIRILVAIQRGSVYYFEEEMLSSEEPHYFIVLNENPRTEDFLVLLVASSQVEKRTRIANRLGFPSETLVKITPSECSLFSKDTIIDCNSTFEKTTESLIEKLETGKLKVCTEVLPPEIVEQLVAGVRASTQVSADIQEMLSPQQE